MSRQGCRRSQCRPSGLISKLACLIHFGMVIAVGGANGQGSSPSQVQTNGLTLDQVLQRVLNQNESIQIKMLESEISRHRYEAEKGVFEPDFVTSIERLDSQRENTQEQQASLFTRRVFNQRNNSLDSGLEFLIPTGTQFRLGYNLRDLENNLNQGDSEYVASLGATLTQPLLKGFGPTATMAQIRLAAVSSDIAFQDYRRELMVILSRAESAYWDLYLTQEQEQITRESVEVAQRVLEDNQSRVEVGRASQLEVLEAEAGLALRKSRHQDSVQRLAEAINQLRTLISGSAAQTNRVIRAVDQPELKDVKLDYHNSYLTAFELNPDYLSRRKEAAAEKIRLAYAENQRLPQLDLKATYGLNGLGGSPAAAFDDVERADFPNWTLGLELRIPITGGIRERNELEAAQLGRKRALLALKEIEVQIGNSLDTSIFKVRNLRESVRHYQSVVDFHEQLLETQLDRLEVGNVDSRTVLETEEDLFEARISALESLIQYQRALLELELVKGNTLAKRELEISKEELEKQTRSALEQGRFSGDEFYQLQQEVTADYRGKKLKPGFGPWERATGSAPGIRKADPGQKEKARQLLRQKIEAMETVE